MTSRRAGAVGGAAIVGFVAGAMITLSIQGGARIPPEPPRSDVPVAPSPFVTTREDPDTYLAWSAGGLPPGFSAAVRELPAIRRIVVVASDSTWLTRSFDEQGEIVDDPPPTFSIPFEVAAVDPGGYAPFLPPADRGVAEALADGLGVLGESSAKLRGLGPGAVLRFGDVRVEVAAVLPDELVGAHELLVARDVGLRIGVTHDRYALLVAEGKPAVDELTATLLEALPSGTLLRVRAPGETPYFRHADAVLPPVAIKELFGEFAAKPQPDNPAFLILDPAWVRTHIATRRIPLLGRVTCHVALFPQIRGVISQLVDEGLEDTIHSYSGCYAPRRINRDASAGISHHSWGIALDLNVQQGNLFGQTPHQDPRLVKTFEDWGFIWGGTFIRPDGMHFEYRRPPAGQ